MIQTEYSLWVEICEPFCLCHRKGFIFRPSVILESCITTLSCGATFKTECQRSLLLSGTNCGRLLKYPRLDSVIGFM